MYCQINRYLAISGVSSEIVAHMVPLTAFSSLCEQLAMDKCVQAVVLSVHSQVCLCSLFQEAL